MMRGVRLHHRFRYAQAFWAFPCERKQEPSLSCNANPALEQRHTRGEGLRALSVRPGMFGTPCLRMHSSSASSWRSCGVISAGGCSNPAATAVEEQAFSCRAKPRRGESLEHAA
jgi:hypothetical protein